MTIRLMHVSDTHGQFNPLIGDFEIILCSGDFLQNDWANMTPERRGLKKTEPPFQKMWLLKWADKFREWTQNKPFIFCTANHEFLDPGLIEKILQDNGVDAHCVDNKIYTYDSLNITGFSFVPYHFGSWNNELMNDEMIDKVERLGYFIEDNKIDILLAHAPIANILDYDKPQDKHLGNGAMLNALEYKWKYLPQLYCCGHIHSAHGFAHYKEMLISNAATTQHIIEI